MDAVNERRISRTREEYELYSGIEIALSASPGEMTHIHLPPIRNVLRMHKKTMECVETGEPILASAFNNPPEILTAMASTGISFLPRPSPADSRTRTSRRTWKRWTRCRCPATAAA